MPDWLVKIFSSIISVKTAFIALFTCIGLILSWGLGADLMKKMGVPENISYFIFPIVLYSLSHILIEGIHKIILWFFKLKENYGKNRVNKKINDSFRSLVERTIPHLPKVQIDLLEMLCSSEQAFDFTKAGVSHLEKQKYISRIHKVSDHKYLYEIKFIVKEVLITHLALERKKMLEKFFLNLTEEQRYFLSLFFSDSVSEGTRESGVKMESKIFQAAENMSQIGILDHFERTSKTSNKESFRLRSDASVHLEDIVFCQRPRRVELNLDSDYILASVSSGGGARGSW